jgi:RNA polymerase sigma-70 factor (ECF subfamily)
MTNETDDAQLVEDCRGGDERAFEVLVRRYEGPVFNAVLRLVRRQEDARDLTQTVFLKVFQQLDAYDPRFKFYSWLYRIAINESLNHLKRAGRYEPLVGDRASGDLDPEGALAGIEVSRHVQEALMRIRADHRVVLVLRHFLDCSYEDIAIAVGVPEKTVKSRLYSARQELKELLQARGVLP